jgi:hypothetical protein
VKLLSVLRAIVVTTIIAGLPVRSLAQVSVDIGIGAHTSIGANFDIGENVGYPPPPIPEYEQPYVPGPDYIWIPGYWAWGSYGYFWVPGTWTYAPRPGYLWTPGYWGWNQGNYAWNSGYWGTTVGYYGGVNYGSGYYGNGYDGGRWSNGHFRYNRYVTRIGRGFRGSVYADRNVRRNDNGARVGYNGGPHGVRSRPTSYQVVMRRTARYRMTTTQVQHVRVAAQDRTLLARVNHNRPPIAAVQRPLSPRNRPAHFVAVRSSDRVTRTAYHAPSHAASTYHAPVHAASTYHAPVHAASTDHAPVHAASTYHAPVHAASTYHAPVHAASTYHAPVHAAPSYHAPIHAAPSYHAPVHAAPSYHAPVHAAPPYHAPAHAAPPAHAPVHAAPPDHPPAHQAKPGP